MSLVPGSVLGRDMADLGFFGWSIPVGVGLLALVLALTLPIAELQWSGWVYFLMCILIPLYRKFGYVQTSEQPFEHPELGPRMPMRLYTDRAHLQSVGSILLHRAG